MLNGCYIVHYSGLKDTENAENQWFMVPVRPMTEDELQSTIDHLNVAGNEGKFKITIAREGMIWSSKKHEHVDDESVPFGKTIEIESPQRYLLRLEKVDQDNKLDLVIEDVINRLTVEFTNLRKIGDKGISLEAEPVWAFMMKVKGEEEARQLL